MYRPMHGDIRPLIIVSFRNDQFKFKTLNKLPFNLEESQKVFLK